MNAILRSPNVHPSLLASLPDLILPSIMLQTQRDPSLVRTVLILPTNRPPLTCRRPTLVHSNRRSTMVYLYVERRFYAWNRLYYITLTISLSIPIFHRLYVSLVMLSAPSLLIREGRGFGDDQDVQLSVHHIMIAFCSTSPELLLSILPELTSHFLNVIRSWLEWFLVICYLRISRKICDCWKQKLLETRRESV